MKNHNSLFTNNQWKKATGEPFASINPATGETVWQGHSCTQQEVNEAVQNAKNAFDKWSALSVTDRSLYLEAFKTIVAGHQRDFAEIISKEVGKPLWDAMNEVQLVINKIDLSLEAYGNRCAGMIRDLPLARSITRHRPHGVMAVFGPFNFPGHIPCGHIIPALLAGNTIVYKPSELTPLGGEILTKYLSEAGLPEGVFNLVQGARETGQHLAQHPDIQGVLFTGSYNTGRKLAEYYGQYPGKILALELGGNNPLIINEIDNLDAAAYLTIQSAYLSAGQRCTCARRLIVVKNEKNEKFIKHLSEMIKGISVGTYTDQPEPFMGPVISEKQAQQLIQAQSRLKSLGGKPLIEMQHLKAGTGFVSPGLMDVTNISDREDEEYFGPFLQLIWVKDLAEGIAEANRTKYGLTAGLFTKEKADYEYFYRHAQAGIVNWNAALTGGNSAAPFGGIKCSGNLRPSAFYAADYCSYPVASMESPELKLPVSITPGININ